MKRSVLAVMTAAAVSLLLARGATALNDGKTPRGINAITPIALVNEGVPVSQKELAERLFSALKANLPQVKILSPRRSEKYISFESLCPPPFGCLIVIVAADKLKGTDAWQGSVSLMTYRLIMPTGREQVPLGSMWQKPHRFTGYSTTELGQMVKGYIDDSVARFADAYHKGELGK